MEKLIQEIGIILAILVMAAFILGGEAKADLIVGVGTAQANLEPDGTWRQETFQQEARKRSNAYLIGFEQSFGKRYKYRVAYHDFGKHTLAAGFLSGGDHRYDEHEPNRCKRPQPCPATNWAFSTQESQGMEFSLAAEFKVLGLKPYARAGVVYFKADQVTYVPNMGAADDANVYLRDFSVYRMASSGVSGLASVGVRAGAIGLEFNHIPGVRAKDAAFRGINELMLTVNVGF